LFTAFIRPVKYNITASKELIAVCLRSIPLTVININSLLMQFDIPDTVESSANSGFDYFASE
jgi:hypothetical protein